MTRAEAIAELKRDIELDNDFTEDYINAVNMAIKALEQEPCKLDDAREDFIHDVYNTLDFLPTNDEANRIIDSFDRVTKCIEQQPCEDAISRQAVLDAINTYDKFGYTETGCFVREPKGDYVPYIHYDDVIKCVQNVPPVTPQQKTGHWIIVDDCEQFIAKCSECGRIEDSRMISKYPYCHCGAKMQEVEEC